jgi:hypothetical protein
MLVRLLYASRAVDPRPETIDSIPVSYTHLRAHETLS